MVFGLVPVKMLPFDNKNELQLVIDMPEGTPLEATDAVVRDFDELLARFRRSPTSKSYTRRHLSVRFQRHGPPLLPAARPWQADIRVNLAPKNARAQSSHQIALRIRPEVEALARKHGAKLKIVEMPPGPPVLATLVAEVYGRPRPSMRAHRLRTARSAASSSAPPGSWTSTTSRVAAQPRLQFVLDREKAALHGITAEDVAQTLALMLGGNAAGTVHTATERDPLEIELRLPRAARSESANDLTGGEGARVRRRAWCRSANSARSAARSKSSRSTTRTCARSRWSSPTRPAQPGQCGPLARTAHAKSRCRPATAIDWAARASGTSRSTCSATSGSRSARRCSSSTCSWSRRPSRSRCRSSSWWRFR